MKWAIQIEKETGLRVHCLFLGKRATGEILPSQLVLLLGKKKRMKGNVYKNDTDSIKTLVTILI